MSLESKEKVLICLPNDQLGGAEQFLKMMAISLDELGYSVSVYFLVKKKFNGWTNLPSSIEINYGSGSTEKEGLFPLIKKLIKTRKSEFAICLTSHSHLTGLNGFLRTLGLLKIRTHIGRESTSVFRRFVGLKLLIYRSFYFFGYSKLDLLICQTEFMKEQLLQGIPRISENLDVVVMQNPIDLKNVLIKAKNDISLMHLPPKFVVSAGRLIEIKGFDTLINSFKELSLRDGNLHLVILGEGEDRDKLSSLAEALGLSDKVHMPGRVDNVYPYFKKASACVVSSRIEGFPNVLLQMMSQNANVVSTLCAGGIENIPGLNTCAPDDAVHLTHQLKEVLDSSEEKREERAKSFERFLYENSLDNYVKRLLSLIGHEK